MDGFALLSLGEVWKSHSTGKFPVTCRTGKHANSARNVMLTVRVKGPFDLELSLAGAASFLPLDQAPAILATAVELDGIPTAITISQPAGRTTIVKASAMPPIGKTALERIVKWLVWAELDLSSFYRLASGDAVLGPVIADLHGLKPLRPASLFEMAIIAITEQQLSLAAAFRIRMRLVERFGFQQEALRRFPSAETLAAASIQDLQRCGLSRRKAEYVKELAQRVAGGILDFDALLHQNDARIRDALLTLRGFGEWSVEYILARGFGRADALPSGDVGLQRVLGHYFARGRRLTAAELERMLAPFRPFRSIAAYYLAVHWRLRPTGAGLQA